MDCATTSDQNEMRATGGYLYMRGIWNGHGLPTQ